MKRKLSTAEKVRRMIDQGHTNKAIIEKLGIKPQAVYNIRYQINKARGLGAIGTPAPTPVAGIGTPPRRRYTRKVPAGTGINQAPDLPLLAEPAANAAPIIVTTVHGEGLVAKTPGEITMIEPPMTPWERVKLRFFNIVRAVRGLP
jgi:hypothetical protein